MPTQPTAPTALPTTPDPGDRATFRARAYPWSVALTTFSTDLTALATNCFANATEAVNAAAVASAQAAAAQAAVGAVAWVSGTTYTAGVVVYSPTNGRPYRRISTGAGTIDPGSLTGDPTNWWEQNLPALVNAIPISANGTASKGVIYRITSSIVLGTPSNPSNGDWFGYINESGTTTAALSPTGVGVKIVNDTANHTLDSAAARGRLVYDSANTNWYYA